MRPPFLGSTSTLLCALVAKDLFGADGDVESLVRSVRGVQDGARKFSAIGFKRCRLRVPKL